MWNGICTPMDRGCTSCPGYTKSRRSPPLLSASLPKHKPREQHECTNLMHSDLGVVRKLNVAALIDTFCPPHPAHVLSCGRGVEALLLAILDGHHALYKVGARLEERGMLPLLQDGLRRASLNDYRRGQMREALIAPHGNRGCRG